VILCGFKYALFRQEGIILTCTDVSFLNFYYALISYF